MNMRITSITVAMTIEIVVAISPATPVFGGSRKLDVMPEGDGAAGPSSNIWTRASAAAVELAMLKTKNSKWMRTDPWP